MANIFDAINLYMDFTNNSITIDGLPQVGLAPLNPLESDYLKVKRISFLITLFILMAAAIAAFVFIDKIRQPAIIIAAAAGFLLWLISGWFSITLNFKYSGYALRERDAIYRSGWFIQKTRIVPFNRVMHVSLHTGPIERKFGLASISIYTAGSEHADFTIKGLARDNANRIKDWLTEQMNQTGGNG